MKYGTQPDEGTASEGRLTWQTLISGDRTPSSRSVVGVADFPPQGELKAHFHQQSEYYFCLSGSGRVSVNGALFELQPEVALFIPGGMEHGVLAGPKGLRILYGFACDSFDEVHYTYTGADLFATPDR